MESYRESRTVVNRNVPGYHGGYLRVDLTTGSSRRVNLDEDTLRSSLGGSGLGVAILLEEGAAEVDPLSPEAALAFVFSPLVGSPLTTSAKFAVVSKSPLTERINDSLASSGFALAGKKTGHDAIVLVGKRRQPSILVIDDDDVRTGTGRRAVGPFEPRRPRAAARAIGSRSIRSATIGPAGERLVRYATISHDGRHAGRGGSGAVLGSKNIKAIAVRGSRRCEWADPAGLVAFAKRLSEKSFGPATAKYRELGTASNLLAFNRLNVLPTRNFQQGSFAGAVSHFARGAQHSRGRNAGLVRRLHHRLRASLRHARRQRRSSPGVRKPLRPRSAVRHRRPRRRAARPADGATSWASTRSAPAARSPLRWSAPSAATSTNRGCASATARRCCAAFDLIVSGEGLGRLLAEGSRRMAHGDRPRLDSTSRRRSKGWKSPATIRAACRRWPWDSPSASRGADHNRSGAYEVDFSQAVDRRNVGPEAAALAIETEDKAALMDSLILCKFLRGVFSDFFAEAAEMLRLVTGWDVTAAELRQTAARIVTAKKRFNILAGWTPAEDTLPERLLTRRAAGRRTGATIARAACGTGRSV